LNGRYRKIRNPEQRSLYGVFVVAATPDGRLWLADRHRELLVIGRGSAEAARPTSTRIGDVYQLHVDRGGALWIGHYQGGLTTLKDGIATKYGAKSGLAEGPIQALTQDRSGAIWVGAAGGLSRLRNGVWTTWRSEHGVPDGGVQGIVEDDHHAMWIATAQGLSRLTLAALNESPDGSPRRLEFTLYGQSDGLRLPGSPKMANPRIAKARDGRLWICTDDGVAMVDPAHIRHNPLPPPVQVEEVVVDGKPLDLASANGLRFQGRQLRIRYTGLSFTVPERVRFRYRLEGRDPDWIDAGTRRSVDYVNLSPGPYHFRVTACNNDGVWNETGTLLTFRVEPYFYQTAWFFALCFTLPPLLAWGVHRMRVRRLVARFELIA
jgi:ligand-binding sensor domain-containing protein